MRICVIGAYPPEKYGVGVYTRDLVRSLKEIDPSLEITILSRVYNGPNTLDGARVLRVIDTSRPLFFLSLLGQILRIRPDIAHVQHEYYAFGGTSNLNTALFVVLMRLCFVPLVVTMHEVYRTPELSARSRWKALARYLLFKIQTLLICRCSTSMIVHTELSKTVLERQFSAKQVMVIPHGTRTSVPRLSSDEAKKALHLEGRKVVMSFGSLRPGKGLEYAIESMAIVTKRLSEAVLILAGDLAPGYRGYLEQISNLSHGLGVADSVVFTGRYVEEEELPLYFSAADAIILPYLGQFRSGSGVLHLAASYGKPVVASDVGEAAEVLRRCAGGMLVPQADSISLADALTTLLLDEPGRAKMGLDLQKYVISSSSWRITADATLKTYRNSVRRRG